MPVALCFRLAEPPRQRQNAAALLNILDDWHGDDLLRHNPIQRPDAVRVTQAGPSATAMPSDFANLPIREAASEIIDIEHSVPLDGDFDIALGDTFTDAARITYQRQERTATICHYRLQDVTLDASTMLLVRGRRRIPETRYLIPDDAFADMLTKPLYPTEVDPAEHYVIGSNRAWHDYYNWMIQALPAIDASLRRANHRRITLVLPPSLQPFQEETLRLLGYQDLPRLTLDVTSHYRFASAEFSDFLADGTHLKVSRRAIATYRSLSLAAPWLPGAAEEIYVARTDATVRTMQNEAELIDLLQRQGVRIIVPGALSVAEQIAAFRAARLVIGPHGAGLSNLVFCRSGSFVYEMLPRHYPNVVFNRVAQAAGLNYAADMFESSGAGSPHERPWRIDIALVAARLAAIRARIAATPRIETAMEFLRRTQAPEPGEAPPPPQHTPPPVAEPEPPPSRAKRPVAPALKRLLFPWRRHKDNGGDG
jgi:hypothetical protein